MPRIRSPYETQPPSARRLLASTLIALIGAALAVVVLILPAEYGVDPTGAGRALGLTAISEPARTIKIADVVGGNESYRNVELPEFGQPVPLPNPAVHQDETRPFATRTIEITLPPEKETEIKAALKTGKMMLYAWHVDRGGVYTDFHGHDPQAGDEYWVRYKEQQQGSSGSGSLVAPFAGEHGWYWLNYNDFPIVITLTVSGYYDDIVNYGIL